MDAIGLLLVIVTGLLVFDVAALRGGVDSRPSIGDDHQRKTSGGIW